MNDIIKDVAKLTTIPEFNLSKLSNICVKCISHCIVESIKKNENICTIYIGIGTLLINISSTDLQFKFIPSSQLQSSILRSMSDSESDLVIEVEDLLKDKIINTYKNLL